MNAPEQPAPSPSPSAPSSGQSSSGDAGTTADSAKPAPSQSAAPGASSGGGSDETLKGGYAGAHTPLEDAPRLVGASTGDEYNTLIVPLVPVACWRVDDVHFMFDSSFVLPSARPVMGELGDLIKAYPGSPLSIFGHADPVGSDDYNKQLSGRRAQAIYALLLRDADAWETLYTHPLGNDKWQPAAIEYMLSPSEPLAEATGAAREKRLQEAVKKFQGENDLKVDGQAGPQTRRKLYLSYMDFLCGPALKLQKTDFLGEGTGQDDKGALQGCSEFNPVRVFSKELQQKYDQAADKTQRNADNAINRRVLIFLFRKGTKIDPAKWPCPSYKEGVAQCKKRLWSDSAKRRSNQELTREYKDTEDTFACRFYDRLAATSPCEQPPQLNFLIIRLRDPQHEPLAHAAYRLVVGDAHYSGVTDEDGKFTQAVPANASSGTLILAQGTFALTIQPLPPADKDPGAQARLTNLGYIAASPSDREIEDALHLALLEFQNVSELQTSGTPDAPTKQKLEEMHGS